MPDVWLGLTAGLVFGGGLGDDGPSIGGAKNVNNDDDSANGGQGLFSLWGHETWLYLGGIVGIGDSIGLYATTGPMIGANPDWAIGGGVHVGKAIGVGLVVPIRQALQSYAKHQDKIPGYIDIGQQYLASARHYLDSGIDQLPAILNGLGQVLSNYRI